jgi:hypothetical protein
MLPQNPARQTLRHAELGHDVFHASTAPGGAQKFPANKRLAKAGLLADVVERELRAFWSAVEVELSRTSKARQDA